METRMPTWLQAPITGENFMTPIRLRRRQANGVEAELSRGEGFDHETIFGVTVRFFSETAWRRAGSPTEAGACYRDYRKAVDHYNTALAGGRVPPRFDEE